MKGRPRVSDALRAELLLWSRTGAQDYGNAGSPAEMAADARVRPEDDADGAYRKVLKRLLASVSPRDLDISGGWSDAERRKLLLAWAQGWARAAARDCLEEARRGEDEDESWR